MITGEAEVKYPKEWAEIITRMSEVAGDDAIVLPLFADIEDGHLVVVTVRDLAPEGSFQDFSLIKFRAKLRPKLELVA